MRREQIIRMAREAGIHVQENNSFADDMYISVLYRFAALVAAAELEACAQLCEEVDTNPHVVLHPAVVCAAAIRERKIK